MAKQKDNLNDEQFIDWLGIINSIKLHFSNNDSHYKAATQHCMIPDMSVKPAYSSLIKSLKKPSTSQNTLEKSLDISTACRLAHHSYDPTKGYN